MKVFKYEVDGLMLMPKGAKILCVQVQQGTACVWAMVDPNAPKVSRLLHIIGTGHDAPHGAECRYIGTFQLYAGALVFHLFDGGEEP